MKTVVTLRPNKNTLSRHGGQWVRYIYGPKNDGFFGRTCDNIATATTAICETPSARFSQLFGSYYLTVISLLLLKSSLCRRFFYRFFFWVFFMITTARCGYISNTIPPPPVRTDNENALYFIWHGNIVIVNDNDWFFYHRPCTHTHTRLSYSVEML